MVVHIVLVAEHKPIVGNGFHQGFVCPGGLRCLHPPDALADQVRAPGRDRARTHLSYVKLEVSLCTESPQVRFAQPWLARSLALAVLHTVANRCTNYLGGNERLCTATSSMPATSCGQGYSWHAHSSAARIGSFIMGYGWLAFASQHCDRTCKFWTDEWRAPHHAAFGQLTWRMFDAICRISFA